MSYKSSSRQFDGVVYASDIKPCDYLLDYINGKGQFYVENSYYPLVKYVYDEKNKRPFVEDDFKTDGGINVKTPRICFKYGGNFQRYFSIVWNTNTASNNKQFFCLNAYMGWDEKNKKPLKLKPTDGKVRPFEIQISSQTDFDDSPDDMALSLLTFHLSEVFSILTYAYIFDLNLADDDFKKCKDNKELYQTFADKVNKKLTGITEIVVDEEMIERYNDIPIYIKDPDDEDVTAMQIPVFWDGEEYKTLWCMQNFMNEGLIKSDKKGPKLIDGIDKIIDERRTNILKIIVKKAAMGNRFMLRLSKPKDDGSESRRIFGAKGVFIILNTESKVDRDKCAGLCTKIFDKSKRAWVPIDSEEFLMKHYRQKLSGDIYFKLEFKLGTTGKGTFTLKPKVEMFDVKILPRESSIMNGATLRALHRIEDDEKTEALATNEEAIAEVDIDAKYNEISGEDLM